MWRGDGYAIDSSAHLITFEYITELLEVISEKSFDSDSTDEFKNIKEINPLLIKRRLWKHFGIEDLLEKDFIIFKK